jgi:lysophospholipase L1-like esterase
LRVRLPALRSHTGRRRALVAVAGVVLAAAGLAACNIPPPSQPPKVILYGDSLSVESGQYFQERLEAGGIAQTIVRAGTNTAICDWFDEMEADVQNIRPTAVLIQFTGNPAPGCVGGQDALTKYREDAQRVVGIFNSQGVHTYFVASPKQVPIGGSAPENPDPWREMYFQVALDNSTRFADAGHSLYNFGTGAYTFKLPCRAGGEPGCNGTEVQVRDPTDGLHFCPSGARPLPCEGFGGYVPGAWRFGSSMAGIVGSDLGLL